MDAKAGGEAWLRLVQLPSLIESWVQTVLVLFCLSVMFDTIGCPEAGLMGVSDGIPCRWSSAPGDVRPQQDITSEGSL